MNSSDQETELRRFQRQVEAIYGGMAALLVSKRRSYGTDNLTKFGTLGIVIRISDKVERLATMHSEGRNTNDDGDTMRDAFQDILGYATLALKLMDDEAAQVKLTEALYESTHAQRHPDDAMAQAMPEHRPLPEPEPEAHDMPADEAPMLSVRSESMATRKPRR